MEQQKQHSDHPAAPSGEVPFGRPLSQEGALAEGSVLPAGLHAAIMDLPCNENRSPTQDRAGRTAYFLGFLDARMAAAELVSGLALPALPVRVSEWQPIETAPKDANESVLLLMAEGSRSVGRWDLQQHHKNPRPYWTTEKGFLFGKAWDRDNQPTHWMPLPAPPSA